MKKLILISIQLFCYLAVIGQKVPVFNKIKVQKASPKTPKATPSAASHTPQSSTSTRSIDGYYEYYPISRLYLYSGLMKNGQPSGYAFIYSRIDTSLLYEGELKDGNYNPENIIQKPKQELNKGFSFYLEQGEIALNNNRIDVAIEFFRKARISLGSTSNLNPKFIKIANMAKQRGDKFLGFDEYQTALDWYLVAQALIDDSSIQNKIKKCKTKR